MGLGTKLKSILSPSRDGYECTVCQIRFTGRDDCPSCGETDPVQPIS